MSLPNVVRSNVVLPNVVLRNVVAPLLLQSLTFKANLTLSHFHIESPPRPNLIKLFTTVIYRHSVVIPSLCVVKLYHLFSYRGMTVNYDCKEFLHCPMVANFRKYRYKLLRYFITLPRGAFIINHYVVIIYRKWNVAK